MMAATLAETGLGALGAAAHRRGRGPCGLAYFRRSLRA